MPNIGIGELALADMEMIAAMVQCIGYIGFPAAINAITIIRNN